MIDQRSGCKVGWETFDNLAEAETCAARESLARERRFAQGYDFGYLWPGSIQHVSDHPEHGECWIVTTT